MSTPIERGRATLAMQPFSVLLGAQLVSIDHHEVVMEVPMRDALKQQFGFAHGGVLSYLADNALTFAAGAALGEKLVTVEIKVNYVRPAIGERLIARATVVSAGRQFAVTRCDVFARTDNADVLCAVAQGTIARLAERASPEET